MDREIGTIIFKGEVRMLNIPEEIKTALKMMEEEQDKKIRCNGVNVGIGRTHVSRRTNA